MCSDSLCHRHLSPLGLWWVDSGQPILLILTPTAGRLFKPMQPWQWSAVSFQMCICPKLCLDSQVEAGQERQRECEWLTHPTTMLSLSALTEQRTHPQIFSLSRLSFKCHCQRFAAEFVDLTGESINKWFDMHQYCLVLWWCAKKSEGSFGL